MFDHDLAENQKNQVDIDEDIFEQIILIYTWKSQKLNDVAEQLIVAAEEYEVEKCLWNCFNEDFTWKFFGLLQVGWEI